MPILRPGYIFGLGRDVPYPKIAHVYQGTFDEPGYPMCARGWNRDHGTSYSIWRNQIGEHGICGICLRRMRAGRPPVPPRRRGRRPAAASGNSRGNFTDGTAAG